MARTSPSPCAARAGCLRDGHDVFAAAIEAGIEDVQFVYGERCSSTGVVLPRWNPDPDLGGDCTDPTGARWRWLIRPTTRR